MPRFVVLSHDSPTGLHWDFMLECSGVLRAWALQREPPTDDADAVVQAVALPDHRMEYLGYEGPVSEGRGCVEQYESGTFVEIEMGEKRVVVNLKGRKLNGRATLMPLPDTPAQQPAHWQFKFRCHPDQTCSYRAHST